MADHQSWGPHVLPIRWEVVAFSSCNCLLCRMAPRGRLCPVHPVLAWLQWVEVAKYLLCHLLGLAG